MHIAGNVVLITGASAGIGLATARRFAEAGAKLALVARSSNVPELRRHQRRAPSIPVDSPEHVADRILTAAESEPEEQYMVE